MFGFGNEEILKGENPYDRKKRKEEKRKRSLKDKIRDYCQRHHWSTDAKIITSLDEDSDGYVQPTFKLFMYNVWRNFLEKSPYYNIKYWCQKTFRHDHISDRDLWHITYPIAKNSLQYLKRFKEMERHGYPAIFSEFENDEHRWKDKTEFDKAVENGEHIGGGPEEWEKIINIIIMALEHTVIEGLSYKEKSKWYVKYFGMDPYKENDERNVDISYNYRNINEKKGIACTTSHEKPDLDTVEYCIKETSYHNMPLIFYAEDIVAYGWELFGKWLPAMWD